MKSKLAISSLIISTISWIFLFIGGLLLVRNIFGGENPYAFLAVILLFVGFAASILGIILGVISLFRFKKDKDLKGESYAVWGIVLGGLPVAYLIYGLISIILS